VTTDQNDGNGFSLWAYKFKIISFKSDPWRWNKEWEKVLHTLSPSKYVYPMMGQMYKRGRWDPAKLSKHSYDLRNKVCDMQKTVVTAWDDLEEKGHFVTAWVLLEEGERKRHLLKGIEGACEKAHWRQDSRALCPEITISSMLKQRGRVFIDFISAYRKGKREVGEDSLYSLPTVLSPQRVVGEGGARRASVAV
jgi:hypothetical protein